MWKSFASKAERKGSLGESRTKSGSFIWNGKWSVIYFEKEIEKKQKERKREEKRKQGSTDEQDFYSKHRGSRRSSGKRKKKKRPRG